MKKILSFLLALLLLFSCAAAESLIYGSGTWECLSCGSLNCGQHCGHCGAPIPLWQCGACNGFMTSPYCVNCGMEKYYSLGTAALAEGDYEAAIGYLESSRSPEAGAALARAWVKVGGTFENDGAFEDALYCYQNAEGYGAEVSDKISRCSYNLACALYNDGDYLAAAELLDPLGDYMDSALGARDCRYQQALLYENDGLFAEAAALYAQIPGYEDSDSRYQSVTGALASEYFENGQYDEAAALYGEFEYDDDCISQRTEALRRSDIVKRFHLLQCSLRVADAGGALAYQYSALTAYLDDLNEGDSLQLLLPLQGADSASANVTLSWNGGEQQTAALSAPAFGYTEFVVSLPAEAGSFPFEVFVSGVKLMEGTADILPAGGHRPAAVRSESVRAASATAQGFMSPVYVKITVTDSSTIDSILIGDDRFKETNGMGARVLEESYQLQFIGKTLPLNKGDVEIIAGATQTCAAVVDAVNAAYATLP